MWNPLSGLRNKKDKKPFLQSREDFSESNNSFSLELESGVKLEVIEIPEMSEKAFVEYITENNPEIKFLGAPPDAKFLINKTHEIIADGLFVSGYGVYTLGMGPCSYVTFVTADGVFLYHWLTLKGGNVADTLHSVLLENLEKVNGRVTLLYGPGTGFSDWKITSMIEKASKNLEKVSSVFQLNKPILKVESSLVHVAVLPPDENKKAKIIISKKLSE